MENQLDPKKQVNRYQEKNYYDIITKKIGEYIFCFGVLPLLIFLTVIRSGDHLARSLIPKWD